jgi:hypothetical protein
MTRIPEHLKDRFGPIYQNDVSEDGPYIRVTQKGGTCWGLVQDDGEVLVPLVWDFLYCEETRVPGIFQVGQQPPTKVGGLP